MNHSFFIYKVREIEVRSKTGGRREGESENS